MKDKDKMERLSRGIQRCRRCERAGTREHAVPGEGSPEAKILLLGEAPGKHEDRTGRPFVGRAGAYLDRALRAHAIERKTVFITSVLKCFSPGPPKKSQIEACLPWTREQMSVLEPRLVLVMGRTAERALFGKTGGNDETEREWKGIPCIITCHPAAAMRFPLRHRQFRRDLEGFVRRAGEEGLLG